MLYSLSTNTIWPPLRIGYKILDTLPRTSGKCKKKARMGMDFSTTHMHNKKEY